jgi:integrase
MRDVDLIERTIYVQDSKTENGIREVPIAPELVPRIKRWTTYVRERGCHKPNGYFLCTTNVRHWRGPDGRVHESVPGGPMRQQTVERIVRRVGDRAGIERLIPHRLRRTFGSFLLNQDVRLETVSELLGHLTRASRSRHTRRSVRKRSGERRLMLSANVDDRVAGRNGVGRARGNREPGVRDQARRVYALARSP